MKSPLPLVSRRAFLCGLLVTLAWLRVDGVAKEPAGKPIRLLTIGNSFADDGVRYLRGFANAAGVDFLIGRANISGAPMEKHVKLAQVSEEFPRQLRGYPYASKFLPPHVGETATFSLKQMLEIEPWDYVTIQQVSTSSYKWETYEPHAKMLIDYIHKYAPQAEIVIHQTWAYREDDRLFADGTMTQQMMYDALAEAYAKLAAAYGLRVIPSGLGIQNARKTARWTFAYPDKNFDYAKPADGAVPEQPGSLNMGWFWRNGKFIHDPIHLNVAGCYLAGAIWFERFTGKSVVDNTFVPEGLDAEAAADLRRIAHETVVAFDQKNGAAAPAAVKP